MSGYFTEKYIFIEFDNTKIAKIAGKRDNSINSRIIVSPRGSNVA